MVNMGTFAGLVSETFLLMTKEGLCFGAKSKSITPLALGLEQKYRRHSLFHPNFCSLSAHLMTTWESLNGLPTLNLILLSATELSF